MRARRVVGPLAVAGGLLVTSVMVLGLSGSDRAAAPGAVQSAGPATSVDRSSSSAAASPTRLSTAPPSARPGRPTSSPTPATARRTTAPARAPITPSSGPAAGQATLPVPGATGDASQVITVQAPSTSSTQATVQAWARAGSRWVAVGPAVPAWIGDAGLTSNAREGYDGTPIGSFGLTHAFGNNPDPGTALPYFQADADDWWSGDVSSPTYNTHQHCAPSACTFNTATSENLHQAGWVYGYAVVIDYNTPAVPGKGSAFFLHVTENSPTQGCVSIPQDRLVQIMRWLDPRDHPRIVIGVG